MPVISHPTSGHRTLQRTVEFDCSVSKRTGLPRFFIRIEREAEISHSQWLDHRLLRYPRRISKRQFVAPTLSKNSFNFACIGAIEQTSRHDWYGPPRRRSRTKNFQSCPSLTNTRDPDIKCDVTLILVGQNVRELSLGHGLEKVTPG